MYIIYILSKRELKCVYLFTFFHKHDPKAIDNEESIYEIACACFPILIDFIQLKYV